MISEKKLNFEESLRKIKNSGFTLSVAESCTGGLLGGILTEMPGISSVFKGGIISYSNDVKVKVLKVKKEILDKKGAVSFETAVQMAKGAADLTGSDIAVSITGIAGPDGGTPEKPVGTVYIAVKFKNKVWCGKFLFDGNRNSVRLQSAETAINAVVNLIDAGELTDPGFNEDV